MRLTKILWVHLLILAHAALLFAAGPVRAAEPVRQVVQLNRAWTFTLGDPAGAETDDHADRDWQQVNLPHSFSLPYFLGPNFYVGYGWYRRSVVMDQAWRGKRLTLEFDGVFQDAEIYVNGVKAGRHRGGYTGFAIDITRQMRPGSNTVAVRVNNLWNAQLSPRAGEHHFSGGIYRDVRLVATDPVHVAWYGTFVTTPEVSPERASLRIRTEVENTAGTDHAVTLVSRIYTPEGRLLTQETATRAVRAGATEVFDQQPPAIRQPSLWAPGNPALYRLETEVRRDGRVADRYSTTFGIRSIRWTADRGFFLNGQHLYLVGANVHQDHAGWGDAVSHAGARRDIGMLRDAGFNFIRGSHYPHAPAFSRAADELGMLFWSEAPFWGIGGFGGEGNWFASAYPPNPDDRPGFEDSVLAQTAEMIRIHRNHPSIIAWSNGNEYFFSAPETMDAVRAFVRRQVALMRTLDPTRPAATGGVQRGEVDRLGDLAGYNGDGAALPAYLNPGLASLVSEYGSTIASRPGAYEPGWGNLTEPPDQRGSAARYPWRYPWRSGEAIWAGFDHGTIADIDFGKMGMIDYFRIPKRQYYWYRNEYRQVPPPAWPGPGQASQLSLTADKTVIHGTQGHDDVQLLVTVRDAQGRALSNSPDVTLTIERGPGEFPTGRSITFRHDTPVDIRDGQAAIEFRSYYAGKSVIRASSPGLKDALLVIRTEGPDPYIEGKSPLARARPLVKYPALARREPGAAPGNVVINRPTAATSSAPGRPASMANDGDDNTAWQAAAADDHPAWSIDLENIYAVHGVAVLQPGQAALAYTVELSLDRVQWQPLTPAQLQAAQLPPGLRARFVRVRFASPAGAVAALSEVRVLAVPAAEAPPL
ncbi:beta-galactosidase [Duganella sp. FT92W]|uniref:Beta-galactosidase n=1 Tax=Pseudoduganella rivuli TaxID=2666085 RepID=A0A7X2IMJ5_9BURK|nr:glycoside hydrolase family 2 TIM barrel-domain containing protein [Pseudoduganella rivuli]MRV72596.1 beta-galactosidase [Pseudoduganella rivuli]